MLTEIYTGKVVYEAYAMEFKVYEHIITEIIFSKENVFIKVRGGNTKWKPSELYDNLQDVYKEFIKIVDKDMVRREEFIIRNRATAKAQIEYFNQRIEEVKND